MSKDYASQRAKLITARDVALAAAARHVKKAAKILAKIDIQIEADLETNGHEYKLQALREQASAEIYQERAIRLETQIKRMGWGEPRND